MGVGINYPNQNETTFFIGTAGGYPLSLTFHPVSTTSGNLGGRLAVGYDDGSSTLGVTGFNIHLSGDDSEHYGSFLLSNGSSANRWLLDHKKYTGQAMENELNISLMSQTTSGGTTTNLITPMMRFDAETGRVGIGTSSGQDMQAALDVNGNAFKSSGGAKWSIPSDARLKHDIKPLTGAFERLLRLRGVTFRWNEPEKHGNDSGIQTGFIAQEVEQIFPEWVETHTDGYKAIAKKGFSAVMTESIKEMAAKEDTIQKESDEMKGRLQRLAERVRRVSE
jgi:hypothetical protein